MMDIDNINTQIENVDQLPVIYGLLQKMNIQATIDSVILPHGNWQGLSIGWVVTIWLMHILSQYTHQMDCVQEWVGKHLVVLGKLTRQKVTVLDFTDDRLALCLRYLSPTDRWSQLENRLTRGVIQVYDLKQKLPARWLMRLDKLLLTTDSNVPSGSGPVESGSQTITTTNSAPQLGTHVVAYSYDPLYRLTGADYSGDINASYAYELDAVGNRTTYTATLTNTVVTTYTYNVANQLTTAKASDSVDTWYYEYDNNGNQTRQVPTSLIPANGETRYTYNQRNKLIRVDKYDGSEYQIQAEAFYNGQGHRVQLVAYVGGTPMTATYTLDARQGDVPLMIADGLTTKYLLYGRVGIGEYGSEWQYYLGDGEASVRQLTDAAGMVKLARTFAPFGLPLVQYGEGESVYGYVGAQTGYNGLLYIDGRYYDPSTGRYLTPNPDDFDPKKPGTLNGYLLAILLSNPGGLFIAPLLVLNWRKRKGRKGISNSPWLLLGLVALGVTLVSCGNGGGETVTPTPPVTVYPSPTMPFPPTYEPPTETSTPMPPPNTVTPIPTSTKSATATATCIPLATLVPNAIGYPSELSGLKLKNPFVNKQFLVVNSFLSPFGGTRTIGGGQSPSPSHYGIDLVTEEYMVESFKLPKWTDSKGQNWRTPSKKGTKVISPITGTITQNSGNTIKISSDTYVGLEIELTHVQTTGVLGDASLLDTEYGVYGTDFPHLHLSVHYKGVYYDPGRILPLGKPFFAPGGPYYDGDLPMQKS